MSRYIPERLRQLLAEQASFQCEYCLLPESNSFYKFQVDHIVSIKHGGKTEFKNLAFACSVCNRSKGSDLGTILDENGPILRFFHPRKDLWLDHFTWNEAGVILPKTPIGAATIKIFGFNHPDAIIERKLLLISGYFPGPSIL